MGEDKLEGFVKKTITFLVPTHLGDRYLNKDECDFHETKDGKMVVVEEKNENQKA